METSRLHERKASSLRISDSVSSRVSKAVRKAASRKFSAFTLAELIVVVTILAILATIGFLALSGYQRDAKDSVDKTNAKSIYTAISLESASTGNSPRYYVINDPAYALSGAAIVVFDGNPTTLVAGDWNVPGTNYSAGNPDYVKLKLNAQKFKIASSGTFLPSAEAATDPSYFLIGAADVTVGSGSSAHKKSVSQVVAVLPSWIPAVTGDFPSTLSGSVAGLVHDVTNAASTGALVDGAKTWAAPGCSAQTVSGYSAPALVSGQSSSISKTTANGTVSATVSCSYGSAVVSAESASCNSGYVPSGLSCVADLCGSTVPANASSNASSQSAGGTWHYAASAGQCTFACVANYSWDGSSCRASCTVPVSDTWSGQTYAVTPNGALAHGASLSSSGTAAFGTSPANGSLGAAFSYSCNDGVLSKTATPGTGGCQANYTWNSNWSSPSCAANTQSAACGGSVAANATASTAATYAQTWNGSAWSPTTSWTNAGTTCGFACNSGYFWNGSSCAVVVSDCLASTPTVNAHPYSVAAFNHGTTLSPTSVVAITNGTRTYQQTFSCTNGVVATSGGETNLTNTCATNYTWNGAICAASTQSVACGGSIAANATASTAATYTQTWNGSAWAPTTSWTNTGATCGFACNSGYAWNGSSCAVSYVALSHKATYTSASSLVIPAGATVIRVKAWGGGAGAGGGYAQADIAVTAGQTYQIAVGNAGTSGAGYGGGLSGIFLSSITQANARVIAGGAGNWSGMGYDGWAGGGPTGAVGGVGGYGGHGGGGGSQVAGGAGGYTDACASPGNPWSALMGGDGWMGGDGNDDGWAGGAGYFGGGGGGGGDPDDGNTDAGGGGGSNYVSGTSTTSLQGTLNKAANSADADMSSHRGDPLQPGLVVVYY